MPKKAIVLVLALILTLASGMAFADDEVAYPQPTFRRENGVVIEEGIRAVQDFEVGQSISEDLIGWLCGDDLGGGYPVMAGDKENSYAKLSYQGIAKSGRSCVYVPYLASRTLSETTPVLYSSSTEINAFGRLQKLIKQAYYEEYPYFRLLTPDGDYQLDIFAVWKKTNLSNEELSPPEDEDAFDEWLERIEKTSAIEALPECEPAYGERVVILSSTSKTNRRVALATLRPIRYETEESYEINKWALDQTESTSHTVDTGALGEKFLFLQKDPLWADMRFESEPTTKYRHLSGGGCGPFALANILINILEPEELMAIDADCPTGYGALFCSCSVNLLYCNHSHIPYHLTKAEEYARYLPVILCNFAAGNNPYGVVSRRPIGVGTSTSYVPYVCEALGLRCVEVDSLTEGLQMVREGGNRGGLLCCALDSSPFSVPSNTHFVSVIGVDDEGYAYVLDSLGQKSYKSKGRIVETLESGLGKFHIDQASGVSLSPAFYIEKAETDQTEIGTAETEMPETGKVETEKTEAEMPETEKTETDMAETETAEEPASPEATKTPDNAEPATDRMHSHAETE